MKWWGYKHTNGSVQVKRYFSPTDLQDAYESPFVKQVVEPFDAETREEAAQIVDKRTKEK